MNEKPVSLLSVRNVTINFGALVALRNVSFDINGGEIIGLIGPNGAGKTTVVNIISGVYQPKEGQIFFEGKDRTALSPHKVAALGIARTFQNVALFKGLSTLDNIMMGRHVLMHSGFFSQGFYWRLGQKEEVSHRKAVERVIDWLEIAHIRRTPAGALPYGLQKRVELGRALASEPKLLLLDEPMAGMNMEEKEDVARYILDANEELEATICLIEHDMGVVMDICDRIVVLDFGHKIAEGRPSDIKTNPEVIQAYLGASISES
jgi:branched-chain amino acid transport system ATP-binding protein